MEILRSRPPALPALRPLVTVDLTIFTVIGDELHVLLVKRRADAGEPFPNMFALPGGFVDVQQDADLEACARRKLAEKTALDAPYLEQVGSWGSAKRDPRGWFATHVYFALIAFTDFALKSGGNADEVRWLPVGADGTDIPLAFDHTTLLQHALQRLRSKAEYTSLPVYLLPQEFTLGDLQHAYEVVLGRTLEKSAFRTRMLAAGFIEPSGALRTAANRPAALYKLVRHGDLVVFPRTFKPQA